MPPALLYCLISIVVSPLITYVVMRLKSVFCDTYHRFPVLFRTDLSLVITSNMLAQAFLAFWSYALALDVNLLIAVDLLLGLAIEHWMLRMVYAEENGVYHVPGKYAKQKLRRRYFVSLMLNILVRSSCASVSMIVHVPTISNLSVQNTWLVLSIYLSVRTLLIDCVGYPTHDASTEVEVPESTTSSPVTNSFVITDEEEIAYDDVAPELDVNLSDAYHDEL